MPHRSTRRQRLLPGDTLAFDSAPGARQQCGRIESHRPSGTHESTADCNSHAGQLRGAGFFNGRFMRISGSIEGKSGIINISSGAAHHPYAGWSLYCASKAALEMVTACASMEQRSDGHPLYMAAVAPGVVETGMQEEIRNSRNSDFPMRSKFIAMQKSGDLADPARVARQLLDLDSTWAVRRRGCLRPERCRTEDGCPTIVAKSVIK